MDRNVFGPTGLGDAVYMTCIVDELSKKFECNVLTKFPELFKFVNCKTTKYLRHLTVDHGWSKRSYGNRRHIPETTQWQDLLINFQLDVNTPFVFKWQPERPIIDPPYCIVSAPHRLFGFKDFEMNWDIMDGELDLLRGKMKIVLVGKDEPYHVLKNIDVNLINKTTPSQLADLVSGADYCVGQVGYILPFAEGLRRKSSVYFAESMKTMGEIERTITPEKIICNHAITTGRWA